MRARRRISAGRRATSLAVSYPKIGSMVVSFELGREIRRTKLRVHRAEAVG